MFIAYFTRTTKCVSSVRAYKFSCCGLCVHTCLAWINKWTMTNLSDAGCCHHHDMCVITCRCICECIPVSELMCSLESSLKIPPSSVMWLMGTLRLRLSSSDGCNSQQQQQQQQEYLLPNYSVRKMINFDLWPQTWMWLLFFKGPHFPCKNCNQVEMQFWSRFHNLPKH